MDSENKNTFPRKRNVPPWDIRSVTEHITSFAVTFIIKNSEVLIHCLVLEHYGNKKNFPENVGITLNFASISYK